jgi:5,10-methylenetetrahydromethanopterin reductase
MRIDLRVPVGAPLPEVAEVIARAEAAGFDGIGVHDHPHSARDVFMALALAARRTSRVTLYPATSSPAVRHPVLLASAAQSLEEIAPGRARLTLAPGFLSARSVGQPRARVAEMRVAIQHVQRLLAGGTAPVGEGQTHLRNVSGRATPVFLLAAGPRMTELAGEVADGALLFVGLHRDAIAAARRHLAIGAARSGRSLAGFPIIFIVTLGLAPTVRDGSEWVRRWFEPGRPLLTYPSASNLYWLREAGLPFAEDLNPNAIDDDLALRVADAFGCFGPAEHCAERLTRAQEEAGVDHVFFFPAHDREGGYAMPMEEIAAFERVLRPRLAET